MDQSPVVAAIRARAAIDPGYVQRLFHIESGGNPAAVTGSNRGLAQFGPAEEAQYGITAANRSDPQAQAAAVLREAQQHQAVLAKALGRDPTPGEMYLTHQQGIAGGPALLSADPSMPAWRVVRPFYSDDLARSRGFASGDAMAQAAIRGNIPGKDPLAQRDVNDIGAGDFSRMWVSRFEGGLGNGAPSAAGGAVMPPAQSGALDQVAMGRAPSGSPVGGGAPFDLSAAMGGMPGGGSQGSPQLGMLANALGGFGGAGQQQAPQIKPEPIEMPIPPAMRGSLLATILQRGSAV